MISFQQVSKKFKDGTLAVNNIDFTIEKGELFVLIGPSGCGKTTTLKMINRLEEPTGGNISREGKYLKDWNVQELRWKTGYVLQQIALFPTMNIEENIAVVPELQKWSRDKIKQRVNELLHMVGLEPEVYKTRVPSELSGGQQQRIGVIRALAADPDVVIMDEPFSALDPLSREQLQKDIRRLQTDIKKTIVFVTHDIDEALALGDRICIMKEGEVVQIGTPQEITTSPENDFVKDFIGDRRSAWDVPVKDILSDDRAEERDIAEGVTVHSNLPLRDAVPYFDQTEKQALKIVDDEKVIGVLSYKDIVLFMQKDQAAKEKERI
ncbi:ABC transporter ATP-binding protein [Alteribacillus sp. HJP-4]|uniref:ABC transporter ATP-binding protein n=1 Tax=Alteribacillus sp. HJP-4 TaxID=2775394 RepID=UPI0035CD1D73